MKTESKWVHQSRQIVLTALMIAGGLLLVMPQPSTAESDQGPTVKVVSQTLEQHQVTLDIASIDVVNLGAFQFEVVTDTNIAEFSSGSVGQFWGSTGRAVNQLGPLYGPSREAITLGAYTIGTQPGPNGEGSLAEIQINIRGTGLAPLTLSGVTLTDTIATEIDVDVSNASLQVIPIHAGWNLLGACNDNTNVHIIDSLSSIEGIYETILGEDGSYVVGIPDSFQTLDRLTAPYGYWLRAISDATLVMVGLQHDTAAGIPLHMGWNWISFCGSEPVAVHDAFLSIDGQYELVIGEAGTYVVGLPNSFQTLTELSPGAGYQIRMNTDGVLQYPIASGHHESMVK